MACIIIWAMARRNIPPGEWGDFLEDLSLQHESWLVDVEMVGDLDPDEELLLHESTLDAIALEEDDDARSIIIAFTDNKPVRIDDPVRVFHEDAEEEGDDILEVESDRHTVRLHFRLPPQPDREDASFTGYTPEDSVPPAESVDGTE